MKVLVVEDDMLVALQLEDDLSRAGHDVVGVAASVPAALRLAEREEPELALVDVHLGDEPLGLEVARGFIDRGILVLFVTGSVRRIPADLLGAVGVVEKPYMPEELVGAIAFLVNAATVGAPPPALPSSLRLAPAVRPDADGRYFLRRPSG